MGRLIMVKCNCGFMCDRYRFGNGFGYTEVRKHQTVLAKSGKYGKLWKSLLDSDPELLVDAGYQLFQCPGCHKIISEYCMDLYKSVRDTFGFYTPSPEEVLYEYKHICPDCQKKMTKITLVPEYSQYADPNPEELVICPQCGDVAIASFCGHFD